VDPERTPKDQADALAALVAPQVSRTVPEEMPAALGAPTGEAAAERAAPKEPAPAAVTATSAKADALSTTHSLTPTGGRSPGPRGHGEYFQPVPGANLIDGWRVRPEGVQGDGIDVVAPEGTPVHVVAGGLVDSADPLGESVRVQGDDGRSYSYSLLRNGSVTVAPGHRVEAGRILGAVGGTTELPHLRLEISDPDGAPLNPYELLLGLPDPNELGYGAVGLGIDIDPEPTDREAARGGPPSALAEPEAGPPAVEPNASKPDRPAGPAGPSGIELENLVAGLVATGSPDTKAEPSADPEQEPRG
jgi:hypothetical protein